MNILRKFSPNPAIQTVRKFFMHACIFLKSSSPLNQLLAFRRATWFQLPNGKLKPKLQSLMSVGESFKKGSTRKRKRKKNLKRV